MKYVRFTIEGKPIALARPRFTGSKAYDSQKKLKSDCILQLNSQLSLPPGVVPIKEPILLSVLFLFGPPASLSKKKKAALIEQPHVYRPDISNLVKFVEDVLQDALIIYDDCQITQIKAQKLYASKPKTVIEIIY